MRRLRRLIIVLKTLNKIMKNLKLLLLAPLLFAVSCASSGGGKGVPVPKTNPEYTIFVRGDSSDWRSMSEIEEIFKGKAKITGKTLDLQGGEINGSKLKSYGNSQDERNTPIKIRVSGLTIKNGYFNKIPGGVVAYEDNITFQNIVLTNIGEDGISNAKDVADGTRIINCKFYAGEKNDKSAQLNNAIGADLNGNLFAGGITSVRLQESSAKRQGGKPKVYNNSFKNVDTALNVAGETTVYLKNNEFEGVREKYKTSSDKVKFIEE